MEITAKVAYQVTICSYDSPEARDRLFEILDEIIDDAKKGFSNKVYVIDEKISCYVVGQLKLKGFKVTQLSISNYQIDWGM